MIDLSTTYMGIPLKNPIVPSASPLGAELDAIKRMADSGAAAVTLPSLFEERGEFPIIASLNGISPGGWPVYARQFQEAGAAAVELNIYYLPTRSQMTGEEVEQLYLSIVEDVKQHVTVPVAVKLGPFFSSLPNIAARLDAA